MVGEQIMSSRHVSELAPVTLPSSRIRLLPAFQTARHGRCTLTSRHNKERLTAVRRCWTVIHGSAEGFHLTFPGSKLVPQSPAGDGGQQVTALS
jgi:hypothetical protein